MTVKKTLMLMGMFIAASSQANAAQMQSRNEPPAIAAPTQPVVIRPLDAPAFESDTKHIQAIVGKEVESNIKADTKLAKPVTADSAPEKISVEKSLEKTVVKVNADKPVSLSQVEQQEASTEVGMLTAIRIFAIRWHEVINIALLAVIALFAGQLCRAFQLQNRNFARSVQAAEDAARAAYKNSQAIESYMFGIQSDERQRSFELIERS